MTIREYIDDLRGTTCRGCGGKKMPANSFCIGCYHSLPEDMKRALFRRIGDGYEDAFDKALNRLRLTWVCEVCGLERPDSAISVYIEEVELVGGAPASRNVRHCNDNADCPAGAMTMAAAFVATLRRFGDARERQENAG